MTIAQIFSVEPAQLVVETGHGRTWTMRERIQQITVFPLTKDARPSQVPKMEKIIGPLMSARNHFEHPHFGRTKPCRGGRQLCKQINQGRPQQRQCAQVPAEQIKTSFRRRRAIRLPGRARRFKHVAGDVDGRRGATCLAAQARSSLH